MDKNLICIFFIGYMYYIYGLFDFCRKFNTFELIKK